MAEAKLPDLSEYLEAWRDDVDLLRQNRLLSESRLLSFAKDRGIAVHGVVSGDPGEFYECGWLKADGFDNEGDPLFHPFRLFPLYKLSEAYWKEISFCCESDPNAAADLARQYVGELLPSMDAFQQPAAYWNAIADLCILLEPFYWPSIVGKQTRSAFVDEEDFEHRQRDHEERVNTLLASQDPGVWREAHKNLRIFAALLDKNDRLYLLLRASAWSERERITGKLSGAMWLRHMAEVMRRAFEEACAVYWQEEDEAFGWWNPGGRRVAFGADRPLDDIPEARRYMARRYGLHSGSYVRWYLEGETEYFAVTTALPEAEAAGIELRNLHGNLAVNRNNVAVRIADWLASDRAQKRFSFLSFDTDVPEVRKRIGALIKDDAVVGYINASTPDFELANFTGDELLAIALYLEMDLTLPVQELLNGEWASVRSAGDFRDRYVQVIGRQPSGFKSQVWGRTLAEYALQYPDSEDGHERPFVAAVRAALRTRRVMYDRQQERFCFDPVTFEAIER